MPNQLTLPACALPGCRTTVTEWGDTCHDCRTAFGPMLRPGPRIDQAAIETRDREVRATYASRRKDTR